jgi:hypothetical protein
MTEPARSFYVRSITKWRLIKQRAETQVAVWEKALVDFDEREDEIRHGAYVYTRDQRRVMEKGYHLFYFLACACLVSGLPVLGASGLSDPTGLVLGLLTVGLAVLSAYVGFRLSHYNLRKAKEE